jgi:hypothetical protein
MDFEGRVFVNWEEAAQMLGIDQEALRQSMLFRWCGTSEHEGEEWLPVILTRPRPEFMTKLEFGQPKGQPDLTWNDQDSYYANQCEKAYRILSFEDGSSLPLHGYAGMDFWHADHGHRTGWPHCFTVGGHTLVVSPQTVINACVTGYMDTPRIAPLAWCESGFSFDLCFAIVDCDDTYESRPTDLMESTIFRRDDVIRLRNRVSGRGVQMAETDDTKPAPKPKRIRSDREDNLLRVIAGLWALSGLPPEHHVTADKLEALFQSWDWEKPAKSAIAETMLRDAANLPGARVRKSD